MRKLLLTAAVCLWSTALIAVEQGYNFRATSGYVTDGTDETYVLGETTSQSRGNFGSFIWVAVDAPPWIAPRDRTTGNDRRLAGQNGFTNGDAGYYWELDLNDTGNHIIGLALGDASYATNPYMTIYDGSCTTGTSFFTVDGTAVAADSFMDANGDIYTDANWPTSHTTITRDFQNAEVCIHMGDGGTGSDYSNIAHFYIEEDFASGPSAALLRRRRE